MMDSCSKMEAYDWKEARKATCRLRMRVASLTNRLGNPSAKDAHLTSPSSTRPPERAARAGEAVVRSCGEGGGRGHR
jgi:hypothetical protein